MHSVSAAIEYVCSTTTAENVAEPTMSLCTAGNPTLPMAAIGGASATVAARTTSRDKGVLSCTPLVWTAVAMSRITCLPSVQVYSNLEYFLLFGGVFVKQAARTHNDLVRDPRSAHDQAVVDVRAGRADAAETRFVWPRAESNLYAEPKKLIAHGYACTHPEPRGKRPRTVYTITPCRQEGCPPTGSGHPPRSRVGKAESMVKFHFATGSTKEQLLANIHEFCQHAVARWQAVAEIFRPNPQGNEPFPNRTHLNVIPGRLLLETARLQAEWADRTIEEIEKWDSTTGPQDQTSTLAALKSESPPEPPESQPQASVAL